MSNLNSSSSVIINKRGESSPVFPLALTAQHYHGHIAGLFAMKANLKLADFTAKTGRFRPGLDMIIPGPIRRYIMRQNYNCMVRLG
jgi:hypothetical protein